MSTARQGARWVPGGVSGEMEYRRKKAARVGGEVVVHGHAVGFGEVGAQEVSLGAADGAGSAVVSDGSHVCLQCP